MSRPKVFISHAREDKDRFVTSFATELHGSGIEVWLDEWEMLPGDKLIEKIFDEGIKNADVFIVVISSNSINKNWVKEELDVALVSRIEKGTKLIPVIIDEVEIPESLKATVWVSVENLKDFSTELQKITEAVFGVYQKPPIGSPPRYVQIEQESISGLNKIETLTLQLACELEIEKGHGSTLVEELTAKSKQLDLSIKALQDSLEILVNRGYMKAVRDGAGGIIMVNVLTYGFFEYAKIHMPDLGEIIESIEYFLINEVEPHAVIHTNDIAGSLDVNEVIVERISEKLAHTGMIKINRTAKGYFISNVSPELRRRLD